MASTVVALLFSGARFNGLWQLHGQRYSRAVYACTLVRACSFTLLGVRGVVVYRIFNAFPSLPSLSVVSESFILFYSVVFFHWTSTLNVTGTWARAGFGGHWHKPMVLKFELTNQQLLREKEKLYCPDVK